jgi:hypothetical protein
VEVGSERSGAERSGDATLLEDVEFKEKLR